VRACGPIIGGPARLILAAVYPQIMLMRAVPVIVWEQVYGFLSLAQHLTLSRASHMLNAISRHPGASLHHYSSMYMGPENEAPEVSAEEAWSRLRSRCSRLRSMSLHHTLDGLDTLSYLTKLTIWSASKAVAKIIPALTSLVELCVLRDEYSPDLATCPSITSLCAPIRSHWTHSPNLRVLFLMGGSQEHVLTLQAGDCNITHLYANSFSIPELGQTLAHFSGLLHLSASIYDDHLSRPPWSNTLTSLTCSLACPNLALELLAGLPALLVAYISVTGVVGPGRLSDGDVVAIDGAATGAGGAVAGAVAGAGGATSGTERAVTGAERATSYAGGAVTGTERAERATSGAGGATSGTRGAVTGTERAERATSDTERAVTGTERAERATSGAGGATSGTRGAVTGTERAERATSDTERATSGTRGVVTGTERATSGAGVEEAATGGSAGTIGDNTDGTDGTASDAALAPPFLAARLRHLDLCVVDDDAMAVFERLECPALRAVAFRAPNPRFPTGILAGVRSIELDWHEGVFVDLPGVYPNVTGLMVSGPRSTSHYSAGSMARTFPNLRLLATSNGGGIDEGLTKLTNLVALFDSSLYFDEDIAKRLDVVRRLPSLRLVRANWAPGLELDSRVSTGCAIDVDDVHTELERLWPEIDSS
jgi:hypothetical protein